jgi:4-coumarate--CoA ligase
VTFANPTYTPNELTHQIEDSSTACVFVHPQALLALRKALPPSFDISRRVVLTPHTSNIPVSVRNEGWLCLDDFLDTPRWFRPVSIEGQEAVDTTVFLYYSSGTTGKSKGVETTHYNMVSAFEMSTANWHAVSPTQCVSIPETTNPAHMLLQGYNACRYSMVPHYWWLCHHDVLHPYV